MLIVTIWIIAVLVGITIAMAANMRVEVVCSANEASKVQAEAIEAGAVQYLLANLEKTKGRSPTDAEMPCEAVRVGDGAFWIIRPNFDDDQLFAYGVTEEAAKINLNTAPTGMLTRLMTDPMTAPITVEMGASVVDWRDTDDTVTQGGAEKEYYLLLPDPYEAKNADFETVEELLLVKGFTREILYGEDVNRNGVLDAGEDTDGDGELDRGIAPFLTVWSAESNTDSSGAARTSVNQASTALNDLLGKTLSGERLTVIRDRVRLGRPFRSMLDFYVRTGLKPEEFDAMSDKLTTDTAKVRKGLVNVATAPAEVLATLPLLTASDVTSLISKRSAAGTKLDSLVWVAQALSRAKASAIGSRITVQSYQFMADIVSVSGDGRAFRRCQVVVDTRSSPARVVYRRNLTASGWPLEESIQSRLRAGENIDLVCLQSQQQQQQTLKTSNP